MRIATSAPPIVEQRSSTVPAGCRRGCPNSSRLVMYRLDGGVDRGQAEPVGRDPEELRDRQERRRPRAGRRVVGAGARSRWVAASLTSASVPRMRVIGQAVCADLGRSADHGLAALVQRDRGRVTREPASCGARAPRTGTATGRWSRSPSTRRRSGPSRKVNTGFSRVARRSGGREPSRPRTARLACPPNAVVQRASRCAHGVAVRPGVLEPALRRPRCRRARAIRPWPAVRGARAAASRARSPLWLNANRPAGSTNGCVSGSWRVDRRDGRRRWTSRLVVSVAPSVSRAGSSRNARVSRCSGARRRRRATWRPSRTPRSRTAPCAPRAATARRAGTAPRRGRRTAHTSRGS